MLQRAWAKQAFSEETALFLDKEVCWVDTSHAIHPRTETLLHIIVTKLNSYTEQRRRKKKNGELNQNILPLRVFFENKI